MESTRYNYIYYFIYILLMGEIHNFVIQGIWGSFYCGNFIQSCSYFFLNINLVFPFSCKTIHDSTCSLTIHSSSCHPIVWGKMTLWNRCLKKMCTRQNWGNILLPPCNWTKKILTKNLHQYLCSLLTFSWHALL